MKVFLKYLKFDSVGILEGLLEMVEKMTGNKVAEDEIRKCLSKNPIEVLEFPLYREVIKKCVESKWEDVKEILKKGNFDIIVLVVIWIERKLREKINAEGKTLQEILGLNEFELKIVIHHLLNTRSLSYFLFLITKYRLSQLVAKEIALFAQMEVTQEEIIKTAINIGKRFPLLTVEEFLLFFVYMMNFVLVRNFVFVPPIQMNLPPPNDKENYN